MRSVQKDIILNNIHLFPNSWQDQIWRESEYEDKQGVGRLGNQLRVGGMKKIPNYKPS